MRRTLIGSILGLAALRELRGAVAEEKQAREASESQPAPGERLGLRFTGFTQVDWVIHNQSSQNEINGSTGLLLNQDRFELRREHLRLDIEQGLVLGRVEIDANTTNGPQVRPIDAEVSLRWPRARHRPPGVLSRRVRSRRAPRSALPLRRRGDRGDERQSHR